MWFNMFLYGQQQDNGEICGGFQPIASCKQSAAICDNVHYNAGPVPLIGVLLISNRTRFTAQRMPLVFATKARKCMQMFLIEHPNKINHLRNVTCQKQMSKAPDCGCQSLTNAIIWLKRAYLSVSRKLDLRFVYPEKEFIRTNFAFIRSALVAGTKMFFNRLELWVLGK